jgi:hypothetical protein
MEEENEVTGPERRPGATWLWFFWGCALSVTTLCALVLLIMLLISTSLNVYLAWVMSGYELNIVTPAPVQPVVIVATATGELAMAPAPTPTPIPEPTDTPMPDPTQSMLDTEVATLAAIATQVAESEATSTPTGTPVVIPLHTPTRAGAPTPEAGSAEETTPGEGEGASSVDSESAASVAGSVSTSSNTYDLIPIEGERESRPPEEHGDLNLKLREPQPADFEATLVEIPGSGIDPDAPNLASVFDADFTGTYVVHDWDWGSNSKGELLDDGTAVLVGINTTAGEPIFIPKTDRDIYDGKYVAVVLYASEDSLTFVYARAGNVANGYTVHYEGIETDPNLVALFEESEGSELPGLTLDTPVGVATDELVLAMRDNGKFLDARSKLDWWD